MAFLVGQCEEILQKEKAQPEALLTRPGNKAFHNRN